MTIKGTFYLARRDELQDSLPTSFLLSAFLQKVVCSINKVVHGSHGKVSRRYLFTPLWISSPFPSFIVAASILQALMQSKPKNPHIPTKLNLDRTKDCATIDLQRATKRSAIPSKAKKLYLKSTF